MIHFKLIIQIVIRMTIKYSEDDLKKNLIKESIGDTNLYYSLVRKEGKTLSFFANDRLLIYDDNRKIIFYNNDYSNTPFKKSIPDPKNSQFTPLKASTFKNPPSTNEIQVRYTGNNSKGQISTIQWNFTCFDEPITKKWIELFQQQKNKIIQQLTGEKDAGFIHDAFLGAITITNRKETILKPEEQMIKTKPLEEQNKNIHNSRLSNSKIQHSRINESNHSIQPFQPERNLNASRGPGQSNINDSKLNISKHSNKQFEETQSVKYKDPNESAVNNRSKVTKDKQSDWNFMFLQKPHESTILQFQNAAHTAFRNIYERDSQYMKQSGKEKDILKKTIRSYESDGFLVKIANLYSKQAALLKKQFRNYHFILESCKNNLVVHVPLTVLIEWQGIISLIKAPISNDSQQTNLAKVLTSIKELQRYTRVSNSILDKATIYQVHASTTSNPTNSLIYLDNLIQYLPLNVDDEYSNSSLRPEFLLDNVMQLIPGGTVSKGNKQEWRLLSNVCEGISKCVKQLAESLSNQELLWTEALQLKDIFHSYGVNLKYLPKVYTEVSNKHVRRYLQTVMAAKVAKQLINEQLLKARKDNGKVKLQKLVQDCIRTLIQGNTSNSSEYWKQLSIRFKKQYLIPINNSQIVGGMFLNSILKLLRVKCDVSKINQSKRIFKDQGIINPGFVVSVEPKIKSYYKFTTQFIEKVRYACRQERKDEDIYDDIVKHLQLETKGLPLEYSIGSSKDCLMEYLSYYVSPPNMDQNAPLQKVPIYEDILQEPPSSSSLKITKSYLNWAIKKQKSDEFKKIMEIALKIADFWFQQNHLYHCQLYQMLSDYYASIGNGEESINFMKESLSRCIRISGVQSKSAGSKYYELGERQLKIGRKKEALQNFSKAKMNMQTNKTDSISYPKLLMRLSALNLNNGNIQGCIEGSMSAIKHFEQYDIKSETKGLLTQSYKIKSFEVLSRAYEINGRKNELKEMALLCSKKFNKTKTQSVYEQLVRICLTAAIFKSPVQKCNIFTKLIQKMLKEQDQIQPGKSLRELINLSETMQVMDKFIQRFELIEKVLNESQSKKPIPQESKDFLMISKLILGVVGQDFIFGLINQKQYE